VADKQRCGVYTIQQTSSKLPANVFKIHVLMLDICWTFAGSCKRPITNAHRSRVYMQHRIAGEFNYADYRRPQTWIYATSIFAAPTTNEITDRMFMHQL